MVPGLALLGGEFLVQQGFEVGEMPMRAIRATARLMDRKAAARRLPHRDIVIIDQERGAGFGVP